MPVSEDEFERPVPISKAQQRKSNKPIMEKRRRARINHCLNELKTLILDAMKKDPARHSKLEKADILEMTVKHLQQIQRRQLAAAVATDPGVMMRFKSGFDECAAEVTRYVGRLEGVDGGVKQRLTAHLHRCVDGLHRIGSFPHHDAFSTSIQNRDENPAAIPSSASSVPGDVNNNSNQTSERLQIPSGLQLIPSRLPTGELALLLPNSNRMSDFLNPPIRFHSIPNAGVLISPNPSTSNHGSAFTAVNRNKESRSPLLQPFVVRPEKSPDRVDDFKKINIPQISENSNLYVEKISSTKTFSSISSTVRKTVPDSTTSGFFPRIKEEENLENNFKSFQVEIPNTRLKAHVSIPENHRDAKLKINSHQIHQKPNPNFTLNPNKTIHKSPLKFSRSHSNSENDFSETFHDHSDKYHFEKFSKIEPLPMATSTEKTFDPNTEYSEPLTKRPRSTETFPTFQKTNYQFPCKNEKRPLSPKSPKFSLNVKLTRENDVDRCQRISVIVEDVSRNNPDRESNDTPNQKDMWRPW